MAKPRGDLGALVVPKAIAASAVPHQPAAAPAAPPMAAAAPRAQPAPPAAQGGRQTALTVKLEAGDYAALLQHCMGEAMAGRKRPSHQEVMVQAFREFIAARGR